MSKADEIQALKDTIAATNDKLERAEHEKKTLKEINLSLLTGFWKCLKSRISKFNKWITLPASYTLDSLNRWLNTPDHSGKC